MMSVKYLLSIPAAGGRYGLTIGAARVIVDKIRAMDPEAEIHYSGVSSGAISAVLSVIMESREQLSKDPKLHETIHREFLDTIEQEGEWKQGISHYFSNNDIFFNGVATFIRNNLHDIETINHRVHVGYCKLSQDNGLEFKIVSRFDDVEDLIGALMASSHYTWILRWNNYHMYRGDKCIDGVFMHSSFALPGYKNISINKKLFKGTNQTEGFLEPSQDKYMRLYEMGKMFQSKRKINIVETNKEPDTVDRQIKNTWKKLKGTFDNFATPVFLGMLVVQCI